MSVAIVTPWFEHTELWPDYRDVIRAADADEVLIVDNGSTPPLDFGTLRLDQNTGFCGGCNAGLHATRAEIVVFLNNDVSVIHQNWLDRLLEPLEEGALVGARISTAPHTAVDGKVLPYIDGWCLAGYRDELLEIGGWPTGLTEPAYFSDNLLCLEARAHGMRLREANVGLLHKRNGSVDDVPAARAATEINHARYLERARELMAVPA